LLFFAACSPAPSPDPASPPGDVPVDPGARPNPGNPDPGSGGIIDPNPPGQPPAVGNPADLATRFPGSRLYVPAGATAGTPAVVLLHGSEGGTDGAIWSTAEALSRDAGAVTLALCWFGCAGTPDRIYHVPLDKVRDAALWLKSLPVVQNAKVGLFGWSRGGEAAVLLGSLLAATAPFAAVAVHAPSDTVVCAYDPANDDVLRETHPMTGQSVFAPAWSWQGQLLFGELSEPYGSGPRIAVEKYPGPLWVSHGVEDSLWEVQRSYNIVAARQKAGLPTETHFWQGEDHVLMQAQNRAAFAASLAAFMTTNLK
jgi:dienelactone hydrolase